MSPRIWGNLALSRRIDIQSWSKQISWGPGRWEGTKASVTRFGPLPGPKGTHRFWAMSGHVGLMWDLCWVYNAHSKNKSTKAAFKSCNNLWDQSERLRNMTSNRQEYEPIFSLIGGQSKMQAVPENAGVAWLRHCYIPMRLSKEAWESILPLNWCLQLKQRDVSKKGQSGTPKQRDVTAMGCQRHVTVLTLELSVSSWSLEFPFSAEFVLQIERWN